MSIISATTTLDEQEVALGMGKRLPPSNAATQAKEIFWSATNKFVDICRMGLNMRGKKGTLSIGLFPSTLTDKPDRQFHWDIIISDCSERRSKMSGVRYRVKPHPTQGWVFVRTTSQDIKNIPDLLARIVVAEVRDADLADRIISSTPMVLEDSKWRCYDWVADALTKLAAAGGLAITPAGGVLTVDKLVQIDFDGNSVQGLNWPAVMQFAREYVEGKIVDGRYTRYENLERPRPTYNMLTENELWA